jgi:tetratricopeptide (TPR) repeat protein
MKSIMNEDSTKELELRKILATKPHDTESLISLAEILIKGKDYNGSRFLTHRALRCEFPTPKLMLRTLKLLSFFGDVSIILKILSELKPQMWDSAKSLAEISHILSVVNANNDAKRFAEAAVDRDPSHPPSLHMLATLELFYGNHSRVIELAERCLTYLPDDPGAHWLIARVNKTGSEKRIVRLKNSISRTTNPEYLSRLYYALHYECHNLERYSEAWDALSAGHKFRGQVFPYNKDLYESIFRQLIGLGANDVMPSKVTKDRPFTPIFIVGLHRSGTTLTERIITGHSDVNAGEESYDFPIQLRRQINKPFKGELHPDVIKNINNLNFEEIANDYFNAMRWRAGGKPYLTDKLPSNYLNVPLIIRAFPEAKIVMLFRDHIDVAFSSMRTLFGSAGTYSYSFDSIEHYFKWFERLREDLCDKYPEHIYKLDYSKLVNDTEQEVRSLCNFIGIDYQDDMINIQKRKESVATASTILVREGIRKDRTKIWLPYKEQLTGLIERFN